MLAVLLPTTCTLYVCQAVIGLEVIEPFSCGVREGMATGSMIVWRTKTVERVWWEYSRGKTWLCQECYRRTYLNWAVKDA